MTTSISAPDAALPDVAAVTYDLWLTLLQDPDLDRTREARGRAVGEALSLPYDVAVQLLAEAQAAVHAGWDRGRASSVPEIAEGLLRGARLPVEPVRVDAVVGALEGVTNAQTVGLLPGSAEVLTALHDRGMVLGLICDTGMSGGGHLRRLLEQLGVLGLFTVTVFSDEIGVNKPGRKAFQLALDGLGVPPENAVHVGDLRRRDVAGAVGARMRPVRYRGARDDTYDNGPADAPFVIDHHCELLGLLGL